MCSVQFGVLEFYELDKTDGHMMELGSMCDANAGITTVNSAEANEFARMLWNGDG